VGVGLGTPSIKARQMMEINFWAISDFVQNLLPHYRENKSGHIIITGSVVADLHFPFKAHYSASKAALQAYVGSLDQEIRKFGIRLHLLEPGWMRSEFHNRLVPQETQVENYQKRYAHFLDYKNDHNPRFPNGEDVAKVVLEVVKNPPKKLRIAVGPDSKWLNRLAALVGIPEFQRWLVGKIS
jgi:short-subunit dehydrogenase